MTTEQLAEIERDVREVLSTDPRNRSIRLCKTIASLVAEVKRLQGELVKAVTWRNERDELRGCLQKAKDELLSMRGAYHDRDDHDESTCSNCKVVNESAAVLSTLNAKEEPASEFPGPSQFQPFRRK